MRASLSLFSALLATLLSASCVGPTLLVAPPGAELALALVDPPALEEPPTFVRESKDEWVQLTSGEWLRGEFEVLRNDTLEFDSEELDGLSLDWEDVARVHTWRKFTVVLENRAAVTGTLDVQGDRVCVARNDEQLTFRRDDVQGIVNEYQSELDHWSGKFQVGFTGRRGNTEQTDFSVGLSTKRRTSFTRLNLSANVLESEQDGTQVASNQKYDGQFDVFLTSRLYLTPIGVEVLRDVFQNIEVRATPFAGLGYVLVDRSQVEWSTTLGGGLRWTRFDSVQPGDDHSDREGVGIVTTKLTSDLTEKLDFDAEYTLQVSFDGLESNQQSGSLELSYDVWGDLDINLGFTWTHFGDPEPDSNGNTPASNDYRLTTGLSWNF